MSDDDKTRGVPPKALAEHPMVKKFTDFDLAFQIAVVLIVIAVGVVTFILGLQ